MKFPDLSFPIWGIMQIKRTMSDKFITRKWYLVNLYSRLYLYGKLSLVYLYLGDSGVSETAAAVVRLGPWYFPGVGKGRMPQSFIKLLRYSWTGCPAAARS